MKNEKQLKIIMKEIIEEKPFDVFEKINNQQPQGINNVLSFLFELDRPVTAGEIANKLEVSTARVAVLLKKLIKNKFVIKYTSKLDQRITMVEITEAGKKHIENYQKNITDYLKKILTELGEDDAKELIRICNRIKKI